MSGEIRRNSSASHEKKEKEEKGLTKYPENTILFP